MTLETNTSDFNGPIRKDAEVETNDPNLPKVNLIMEANILPLFEGKPWNRLVVSTPLGRKASQTITLTNKLATPVMITGLTHSLGKMVKVDLETVQEGQVYMLTLAIEGTAVGRIDGRIHLHLAGAPSKTMDVLAYVHVWVPKMRVIKAKPNQTKPNKGKQ